MAEQSAQEKTEQPTPHRLQKARDKGRIPVSKEFPSALILTTLLIVLALSAASLHQFFVSQIRQGLTIPVGRAGELSGYAGLWRAKIIQSVVAILPFLLVSAGTSVFAR